MAKRRSAEKLHYKIADNNHFRWIKYLVFGRLKHSESECLVGIYPALFIFISAEDCEFKH